MGPARSACPSLWAAWSFEAGDIIVGDIDGVVVVPRADCDLMAKELEAIADKEQDMEAAVASGAKYPAWLDDVFKHPPIRYVD